MNARWPHRFAIFLSLATLGLVFVGGLVTSTHSGLSVPDWPLSYGRFMPPMIGGILFEHGHRLFAATVGFLTILLAIFLQRSEQSRPWIRKAAWGALGLVILQGVFGGLTVLLRLPPAVSIVHACTAQTFLSLVVSLTVWTSNFWQTAQPRIETHTKLPLHHLALGLFGTLYVQLILGAVVRHTGHGILFHIAGAFMGVTLVSWIWGRTFRNRKDNPGFFLLASTMLATVLLQGGLGFATYLILGHEFNVIPPPFWVPVTITLHVMTGALLLGQAVMMALGAYRTRPPESAPLKTKISDYFELTKPGISIMAGITALAGFVMGSKGVVHGAPLFNTGLGTLLVASGACTLNMLIERDLDARMKRTKKRPIPAGRLNAGEALFAGSFLSALGVIHLALFVNAITAVLAALTLSIYLYIYTPLKKKTALCTAAGAIAGALPPVMGWSAATGSVGAEAWIFFGILFFWQFPHFFSLAWLYKEDYSQVGLRMLPLDPAQTREGNAAGASMLANSLLLLAVSLLPTFLHLSGRIYFFTALGLGGWLVITSGLFLVDRTVGRARKVFFASILYVPLLLAVMVLNK